LLICIFVQVTRLAPIEAASFFFPKDEKDRAKSGKQLQKNKKMNIRKGTKEDMAAVLRLITELAVFEREPDAVVVTVEDLQRDGFSSTPLFHTFIAEHDGQIVGMALYYYRYSTWKGKTIHLEDLIVTEKMRGTGLGSKLYSEIMRQGKRDNVRRIEWNVLDWNTPAIDFYEKSGARILQGWQVVNMDEQGIDNFLNSNT
jgi:GNAT superfamily N-acetyltransferase